MLIIRLKPSGKKKRAKRFRIVLAEKHKHVSKKSILDLGFYNPYTKEFKIDKDLINKYLKLNVELSETVNSLLKKNNVITSK